MITSLDEVISALTLWGIRLILACLIMVASWMLGNWVRRSIQKIGKLDNTLKSFLGGFLRYALLGIAFITVLGQFGVQTTSLLAVLGAAGLAIGLALQGTLSNVAAGVMLLILRPFNVGDYIETKNIKGTVRELGLFGTELATADNIYIFAPNSQIWNAEIFNFSRNTHRRLDLVFPVSYSDDLNKAMALVRKTVLADTRLVKTNKEKDPVFFIGALGEGSVPLTARLWVKTTEYWQVRWDLTKAIKEAFEAHDFSFPATPRAVELPVTGMESLEKNPKRAKVSS